MLDKFFNDLFSKAEYKLKTLYMKIQTPPVKLTATI